VSRFIFDRDRLFKDGRPKPKAFFPDQHPLTKVRELSVCQIDKTPDERVWHLGRTCRKGLALLARSDFATKVAEGKKLKGYAAPEKNYREHAVFVGWPAEEGEAKPLRMHIAQEIAANANTLKAP